MKRSLLRLFALFLIASTPVLRSQNTPNNDPGQANQSGASSDCADPMSDPGVGCAQNGTGNSQQGQQQGAQQGDQQIPLPRSLDQSGMMYPGSLGGSGGNGTSLTGQTRYGTTQQFDRLPPDPPTEFQKFVAATTGQFLPLYGEILFHRVPSTFAPNELAPVPSQYVIGPDDELRVRVWGQINYNGNLRVDRTGAIFIPQVGTVPVAGLQFSAVDQHLRAAIARIFRNFDLSVDIGRIRSMQVYVSGQARRPGSFTVSSLSTLVDALFATGGPSPQGSLRHILVNRDGKTIADFDLYALLIHGDKSKDVHLLPEDVIYIPPAGPQVAITGSVRSPGIYEIRSGDTINDLIETAGKTTAMASSSRISLERVGDRQIRQAMEFGFDTNGLGAALSDGDILRVYSVVPAYSKTITLRGAVANPGRFGWREGMRVSDLIPDRDSLVSRDYWWKRSHLGLPAPEFEPTISTIGEGQQPLEYTRRGLTTSVTQSTLTEMLGRDDRPESNVRSNGASNTQTNQQSNSQTADPNATQTQRQGGSNGTLASAMNNNSNSPAFEQRKRIDVRLTTPEINWNYAVIERVDESTMRTSLIPFDLGKLVINHDQGQNLPLQPGDAITVFSQTDIRVPIDQQVKYVELEGEFVRSGYYSVLPGETLRDVVRRAGGLTPKAYLYGSELTRESTRILQQQRYDDYVRTISLEAEHGTQALAAASVDVAGSREVTQQMVDRLSLVKATGRIVLQFQPKNTTIEDVPEIALENGDKFVVPYAPGNVNVVGAVYDQNSFVYEPGRSAGYYLQLAGGANRNADGRHAFILRADGAVVSRDHVKGSRVWSNPFEDLRLNPGDTIVVPDKTLRPTALRGFLEWSQLFSQLAFGAAAIRVL